MINFAVVNLKSKKMENFIANALKISKAITSLLTALLFIMRLF